MKLQTFAKRLVLKRMKEKFGVQNAVAATDDYKTVKTPKTQKMTLFINNGEPVAVFHNDRLNVNSEELLDLVNVYWQVCLEYDYDEGDEKASMDFLFSTRKDLGFSLSLTNTQIVRYAKSLKPSWLPKSKRDILRLAKA